MAFKPKLANYEIEYNKLNSYTENYKVENINNLTIFYLNVNSIKQKFQIFKDLLVELDYNFDVIVLVETKLDRGSGKFYNLGDNYKSYHNIRHRSGGGSVIFVKESIDSSLEFKCNQDEIEFTIIKLIKLNMNICAIYRPPINSNKAYEDYFKKLEHVINRFDKIILVGDININLLTAKNDSVRLEYVNILNSNNYSILNSINRDMATRITEKTNTIIDHAVTNIEDVHMKFTLGENTVGDHKFIILEIKKLSLMPTKGLLKFAAYKTIDSKKISTYLNTLNIESTDFDQFHKDFCHKVAELTKTKTIKENTKKERYPFYSESLESIKKLRNKFYKLKKNNTNIQFYKFQFKFYKYLLIKKLETEKRKYFSLQISKVLHEPRKLWQKINEIMTDKKNRVRVTT